MEKMTKEQVIKSGEEIFNEGIVVAKVNTKKDDAFDVILSGLVLRNYDYDLLMDRNTDDLYSNNINNDGNNANVIIELSSLFFKEALGNNYEDFKRELSTLEKGDKIKRYHILIQAVADIVVCEELDVQMEAHVPSVFIKGAFLVADDELVEEKGLDNLVYIENVNFYDNLPEERRMEIVTDLKNRFSDDNYERGKLASGAR